MEMYPLVVSAVNVSQVMRTELNTIVFHICDCAASHLAAPMYRGDVPAGKSIPAHTGISRIWSAVVADTASRISDMEQVVPAGGGRFRCGLGRGTGGLARIALDFASTLRPRCFLPRVDRLLAAIVYVDLLEFLCLIDRVHRWLVINGNGVLCLRQDEQNRGDQNPQD